jgi:hypothetical protein
MPSAKHVGCTDQYTTAEDYITYYGADLPSSQPLSKAISDLRTVFTVWESPLDEEHMGPIQDGRLMPEAEVNQGCRCEVWSVTSVPLTLPLLPLIRHPHSVPSLETTIANTQDRCANLLLPGPSSSPTLPGTGEITIDVRPRLPPASCTTLPNTLTCA